MLFKLRKITSCHSALPRLAMRREACPSKTFPYGILLGCVIANTTYAGRDTLTETDLLGDIPVISLATGIEQPLNRSPASTTIIDREMIDASGALNWIDLFRLVPGFQAYSPNANRFAVSYHGLGQEFPNHLEVMVDGRSVYEPIQSTVIWTSLGIDLDDIERIEIVRGSNAATQGSNAFLGAVNIVTRAPLQDAGTRIKVISGERSTREVALRHNNSLSAVDYRLSVNTRYNDGFLDYGSGGPDDGEEALNFTLRTTLTPNLSNTLDIDLGFSRQDTEFGYPKGAEPFIPVRYYSQYQRINWSHLISDKQDVQLQLYRNYFRTYGTRDLGLLSTFIPLPTLNSLGVTDTSFIFGFHTMESERYDLEGRYRQRVSDQFQWTLGFGARHESVDAPLFLNNKGKVDEWAFRLFSHSEWSPWQGLTFNAGAMIENSIEGTLISPRLSVSYDLHPEHTLRLSGVQGKRTPSITETNERLTYTSGGLILEDQRRTEELDEERVTNIELAYLGRLPARNITFDAKLFWEEIRDGLEDYSEAVTEFPTFLLDSSRLVRDNIAEWETRGAEMELSYRPGDRTYIRLHYTYLDLDSDLVRTKTPLSFTDVDNSMPRHAGGLLVNYRFSDVLNAGFSVYHQNQVKWLSGDSIDEFTRVDAQLSYQFKVGASSGKLQLIGQSLGEDYSEFDQENIFETKVLLKATLDFP